MKRSELKPILKRILTKPTAPFHENLVAKEIETFVGELGLDVIRDKHDNLIVVYKPKGKAKKGRLGFVAHTDHPGFDIIKVNKKRATAKWYGGVWREFFKDAKVLVVHEGKLIKGRVLKTVAKKGFPKRVDTMELLMDQPVAIGDFGHWDLMFFKMEGSMVITRAADDLCSVVSELALLKELIRTNNRHEIWLIFTRAEENGFNGAMALIDNKVLPDDLSLISLETSKHLPIAKQGDGPVIRLGDAMNTYSPDLLLYMRECAKNIQKKKKSYKYQSRVMDGGMCEASLFICNNFKTAGIAFPLGNYHNMGDEPDLKGRPTLKAETVHIQDLQNGIILMLEMCSNLNELPKVMGNLRKRLRKHSLPFYKKLKENRA